MPTLRITQRSEGPGRYRAEVRLEGDGLAPLTAESPFQFEMTPQEHEDVRWYLEDFLQYPHDPAPRIAARIEKRMREIGQRLFEAVFESSKHAERLWGKVCENLDTVRVEIVSSVEGATSMVAACSPPERGSTLLRICMTNRPLSASPFAASGVASPLDSSARMSVQVFRAPAARGFVGSS